MHPKFLPVLLMLTAIAVAAQLYNFHHNRLVSIAADGSK